MPRRSRSSPTTWTSTRGGASLSARSAVTRARPPRARAPSRARAAARAPPISTALRPAGTAGHGASLVALTGHAGAEGVCRKAIRLNLDEARAHHPLWDALEAQGKFGELADAARAVIAKKPDHADAHARLGRALLEEGRGEAAVAAYQTAIRLNPSVARFREGLSRALGKP